MPGFLKPYPRFFCPDLALVNWQLSDPMFILDEDGTIWSCAQGSTTDYASIPAIAKIIISGYGTGVGGGSIPHDAGYRRTLLKWKPEIGKFEPAMLDEDGINKLYDRIMSWYGTPAAERLAVFEALQLAGKKAYDGDLTGIIPHLIVPDKPPAVS